MQGGSQRSSVPSQPESPEPSGNHAGFASFAFGSSERLGVPGRERGDGSVGSGGAWGADDGVECGGSVGLGGSAKERWGDARRPIRQERAACSPSDFDSSDSSLDDLPEGSDLEDGGSGGGRSGGRGQRGGEVASRAQSARRNPVGKRLYKQIDLAPS